MNQTRTIRRCLASFVKKRPVLYTSFGSAPGRSVQMLQGLLGLNLDIKPLEPINKEHLTPEYTKKNPMRTIPMFEDEEGFCLADSHAILLHLMNNYAKPEFQYLYPKDINRRSTIESRLFFDCGVLFPRFQNVMVSQKFKFRIVTTVATS